MKTLNVYNSEEMEITVVVDGEDITIDSNSSVEIQTNSSFNSDNFYVDGDDEGNWKAKYNGANKDQLSLYISNSYGWSSQKSECGAFEV